MGHFHILGIDVKIDPGLEQPLFAVKHLILIDLHHPQKVTISEKTRSNAQP